MTPLLRVLVAMPSLGNCSTRKTSCHSRESASAIAQPRRPPPMMRMLVWSMGTDCSLKSLGFLAADFVEEGFAGHQASLGAVVNCIGSILRSFVAVAPQ